MHFPTIHHLETALSLGSFTGAKVGRRGVTIVILLGLVAVLWMVVLAPECPATLQRAPVRRFHRSFPPPTAAARACRSQDGETGLPACTRREDPSRPLTPHHSRPTLVLLRPVADEQSADIDDGDGAHYERVGVIESPEPPINPAQTEAGLAAYRRQQARQRCTLVLRCLTAVAICTGILGVFSSASAWPGSSPPSPGSPPSPWSP